MPCGPHTVGFLSFDEPIFNILEFFLLTFYFDKTSEVAKRVKIILTSTFHLDSLNGNILP